MTQPDRFEERRREMVRTQIASRGIRDERVLDAMRTVPREEFVPPEMVEFAYEDAPLPIRAGQTISQPYIVATMVQALELEPSDRVLEVGAGSGYAAAVLSRVAAEVFAIERHASLVEAARERMDGLGYRNVHLEHGDGTRGWREHAPFDAILVSAGGETIPAALRDQLAPGGRMVIPLGEIEGVQELRVLRKQADGTLTSRGLGAVRFVPLIGSESPGRPPAEANTRPPRSAESNPEPERSAPRGDATDDPARGDGSAVASAPPDVRDSPAGVEKTGRGDADPILRAAEPFEDPGSADLDRALDRMSGHRVVLIGEASHGTSQFYSLRARLTRGLIERGEVGFVAVEADWPDAAHLDRYVRGIDRPDTRAAPFVRFPRWMWANRETLAFLQWLREHNEGIEDVDRRVGFFGLDLYSLHTSIDAVLDYLEDVDPDTADLARERYACLNPWEADPQTYGRLVTSGRLRSCENDAVRMLGDLLRKRVEYERDDGFRYMDALENARLVANAEGYYRAMYRGPSDSWNLRDRHMFDTLRDLLSWHGPDVGVAVWAHNSHLGDASATDMSARGQHNVGQLCRNHFGEGCYAVGQGTHTGTVMAASRWGDPGVEMEVRPSLPGSYERLSHDTGLDGFFLPLRGTGELASAIPEEMLERAIGVIYRPQSERVSHYFHASLDRQFDEWIFIDRTRAVSALEIPSESGVTDETVLDTYPFAL